ncbi:MAG: FG-GAP repeat domain-containing protein, partial [Thiothrix sp.]
ADSRVEAQGKSIAAAWAANKISDTVGNYIAFTYVEDNANGEHRITRIDYTGNAAVGVSPYNAVEFQYEARPDPGTGYLAGSLTSQTQRLRSIVTRANGLLVMYYQLDYETGTTTGRSRLASLMQCDVNSDCLNTTRFAWQEGEAARFESVAVESLAQTGASSNTWFAMGDVNADGRTDAVTLNTSRDMRLYTANNTGALPQTQQFITPFVSTMQGYFNPMDWRFWMDDLNGDGRAEPLICGVVGQYALNGFDQWVVVPWATVPQAGGQATLQMQATNVLRLGQLPPAVMIYTQGCMGTSSNDGKADFVWHAAEYHKGFELFTDVTVTGTYGTVTFTQEGASVPLRNAVTSVTRTADIDGDQSGDMIRYDPSTGALHTWLQRNKAFAAVQSTVID